MGCTCRGSICTLTCHTNPPSTYDCGTEDFSCSPNPCCPDPCTVATSDGPQTDTQQGSQSCSGPGYAVGGTWIKTIMTETFTCEPISPPPEECATTTTTTTTGTPPPPPSNDCDGGGG